MSLNLRRFAFAALAAGLLLSTGIDEALAQGATVAPGGGGVGSTTAPSNSQGTPSGGTGVIGTTRVGPSTTETARPAPRARARRPARRARPASSSSIAAPAFFG